MFDDDAVAFLVDILRCDEAEAERYRKGFAKRDAALIGEVRGKLESSGSTGDEINAAMRTLSSAHLYGFCKSHAMVRTPPDPQRLAARATGSTQPLGRCVTYAHVAEMQQQPHNRLQTSEGIYQDEMQNGLYVRHAPDRQRAFSQRCTSLRFLRALTWGVSVWFGGVFGRDF